MMIDMHCHLDLYEEPFKIAQQCKEKGIYVLSVTTTPSAWYGTRKLELGSKNIKTALGLHPELASDRSHELELFDELLPEAKYIGEIGLDGSPRLKSSWQLQIKVFRHILKSVHRSGGRIMSIHSRGSANSVLEELINVDGYPIFHWFSGTKEELKKAIDFGSWFSISPTMLSTKKGFEITSSIPMNKIITETDAPFTKYKNIITYPWDVHYCFEHLSLIWKIPQEEVQIQIKNNFKALLSETA